MIVLISIVIIACFVFFFYGFEIEKLHKKGVEVTQKQEIWAFIKSIFIVVGIIILLLVVGILLLMGACAGMFR